MEIEFTRDGFFGITKGQRFEVFDIPNSAPYIRVPTTKSLLEAHFCIPLTEIDGWYKIAQWIPKVGQSYKYIDTDLGIVTVTANGRCEADHARIAAGNCFPDTEEGGRLAHTKVVQIRAVLEEV